MNDSISLIAEAERHLLAGQVEQAAQIAQGILLANPQAAMALNVLGHVAARSGDAQAAVLLWETAVRAGPAMHQPWVALGDAMWRIGQQERALVCFREALARKPDLAEVRINYGIALGIMGHHEEAIEALRQGLAGSPDNAEGAIALATSLHGLGRTAQAIDVLTDAASRHPENAKIASNLGVLHEKSDLLEEALEHYDLAVKLAPDDPQALFNRGSTLIQLLRLADARRDWEAALRVKPDDAVTRTNLAILELLDGNLPKGFDLFEARWGVRHQKFPIPYPEWDGSPLTGKHLLLYVEQGLGDTLQFCRFVPILKKKHRCRITLVALPKLHALLRSLDGLDEVIDIHPPYPPADVQCSLLSVPRFLGTTLESIPANTPYLRADPADVSRWRQKLARLGPGPRVGLFWQGTQVDPCRVVRLADLSPLWQAAGVKFVSLQKGMGEEELAGFRLPILALGHQIMNFGDTAAVLQCLDLLITIDSAAAHCAGALARPTWVMLPHRPDWRWLLDRTDSPWYPTQRLYRQASRKDWSVVIEAVAKDLAAWAPEHTHVG